jgi:hypothetical protein
MGLFEFWLQDIVAQVCLSPKGIIHSGHHMARQNKPESKLTEAADKTAALLQGLQSRLNRDAAPGVVNSREETPEDLDQQLREYFVADSEKPSSDGVLDQIRERVIDTVANRILESWERGDRKDLGALENQVIDRVAERILKRMTKK